MHSTGTQGGKNQHSAELNAGREYSSLKPFVTIARHLHGRFNTCILKLEWPTAVELATAAADSVVAERILALALAA